MAVESTQQKTVRQVPDGYKMGRPTGFEPAPEYYEAFAAQSVRFLSDAGDVAGDAQIGAAMVAMMILQAAEVKSLDRREPDRPDCGSPSGPSPQGACLDGSGSRGEVVS